MDDIATIETNSAMPPVVSEPATDREASPTSRRKSLLVIFGGCVVLAGLGWGAYEYLIGSNYVSTDNAYVAAYSAVLTPQTSGAVKEVRVRDAQAVHRGDILVVLDEADGQLALASAEADLERARAKAKQYFANVDAATAKVASSEADIARNEALVASARSGLERARSELQRRQKIERSGAVSAEDLATAKAGNDAAEASLQAAKAALDQAHAAKLAALGEKASAEALAGKAGIEGNAEVMAAQAAVNTARLNLERTTIRAPMNGIVARRRVQVGERVGLGSELLTIVPVDQAYVEANFKETQLRKIRVGQRVTLTADRYGSAVEYQGRVDGIGGGTGAAFAVIPAQNATGNWIKVAQRLPVHIALDAKELRDHPLRVGLSMEATVDVSDAQAEKIAGAD
jgi:membrane fusion protein (multidrug efflux system)